MATQYPLDFAVSKPQLSASYTLNCTRYNPNFSLNTPTAIPSVTSSLANVNLCSDTFHHPSLRAQSAWQAKQSHDKAGLLHKVRNNSCVATNDSESRVAA